MMKYFTIMATLLMLCVTSCDGKYRALESPAEKLEKSNLSKSFFDKEVYFPKSNIAIVTDTIISSGEHIKIKYYSLENQSVIGKNNSSDKQVITTHYREFESEIQVFKNNKLLFDDILNKFDFMGSKNPNFWNKAILQYVWLDDLKSTTNRISINCSFLEPITKTYKTYKVYFNNQGKRVIKLTETS